MNSLAIIRANDILRVKSTLQEMIRSGLEFECKPKEINPSYAEKMLSNGSGSPGNNYEVCALVPIIQEYELLRNKVKSMPVYSDVLLINASHELFNDLVKMMPLLPDLIIPGASYKDVNRPAGSSKAKPSTVFLGVFVNRRVQVQTGSGTIHTGILKHADSIGVFFEPEDNSPPFFITWHDIKKIIIPKEDRK
ncbi:MAG TPA: DUF356 domain-containing protein [Candidatus Methanoperedens sp.]